MNAKPRILTNNKKHKTHTHIYIYIYIKQSLGVVINFVTQSQSYYLISFMKRIKGLNLHSHTYGNNYIIKQKHLISRFLKVKRRKEKGIY